MIKIFLYQANSLGIPETILSGRKTRTARKTLSDSDSLMLLLSISESMPTKLEKKKKRKGNFGPAIFLGGHTLGGHERVLHLVFS